jgi:hypothetical protein
VLSFLAVLTANGTRRFVLTGFKVAGSNRYHLSRAGTAEAIRRILG